MLSDRTLGFLEGLASASGAVYTEGGLQFTFKFAYQQAHACSSKPLQAALLAANQPSLKLSDHDIQEFGRFIQGSLGDYSQSAASRDSQDVARSLVRRLESDLNFDLATLVVEDGKSDMTARLEMAQRSSNNLYSLELWWSVD